MVDKTAFMVLFKEEGTHMWIEIMNLLLVIGIAFTFLLTVMGIHGYVQYRKGLKRIHVMAEKSTIKEYND